LVRVYDICPVSRVRPTEAAFKLTDCAIKSLTRISRWTVDKVVSSTIRLHNAPYTLTDSDGQREREREIQAERVDEQFCITKQFVVAHKWFGHSANAGAVASPNALCSSNDVSTCPNEDRIYSDIIVVHGYIFN